MCKMFAFFGIEAMKQNRDKVCLMEATSYDTDL